MVDLRDAGVNGRLCIAGDRDLAFQHLRYKLPDEVLAAIATGLIASKPTFGDHLIEQARFGGLRLHRGGGRPLWGCSRGITHVALLQAWAGLAQPEVFPAF